MFSVMTLNLRFGLADDGRNSWLYRKKILPDFLKNHYSDFIGLQEVNDFQADFLIKTLSGYDFIGRRSPAPTFWQNNLIFYKKEWKCIHNEHFFLSPTPDIPSRNRKSRWPRQCTLGLFKKGDYKLICVNTHFDFEAHVQAESSRLILERISYLPTDLPAVIMGDFNATPSSLCHNIFTGNDQKSGFTGSYIGPYFKNVFNKPPFPGTHHGFTGNVDGRYIDWILYRGNIVPETRYVIQETINGVYPSDHFPVYASFKTLS